MLMILSPAKTFAKVECDLGFNLNQLNFPKKMEALCDILSQYNQHELEKLMKISEKLGVMNHTRYQNFPGNNEKSYYGIDYFHGEVYKNLDAKTLSHQARAFAQSHLCILSGLYGLINPLDCIKPYRLEMGTKLSNPKGETLYEFWVNELTDEIEKRLGATDGDAILINLASEEYSKVLNRHQINRNYKVITLSFKVEKEGHYKVVSMYAKKARGLMARYILEHQINNLEGIKNFKEEGYRWEKQLSSEEELVFVKQ